MEYTITRLSLHTNPAHATHCSALHHTATHCDKIQLKIPCNTLAPQRTLTLSSTYNDLTQHPSQLLFQSREKKNQKKHYKKNYLAQHSNQLLLQAHHFTLHIHPVHEKFRAIVWINWKKNRKNKIRLSNIILPSACTNVMRKCLPIKYVHTHTQY